MVEKLMENKEYGEIIPENPDAVPIHMPSYALMWKLGGGVSRYAGDDEKGDFAEFPNIWRKIVPFIDEKSLIDHDPEGFSNDVYDAMASGKVVAYSAPHWTGATEDRLKEENVIGQYRWRNPYGDETIEPVETEVDTIFWRTGIGGRALAEVGPHEPMHLRPEDSDWSTVGHRNPKVKMGRYYNTEQHHYDIQTNMMNVTAGLLLKKYARDDGRLSKRVEGQSYREANTIKKITVGEYTNQHGWHSSRWVDVGDHMVESYYTAIAEGKDITKLLPADLFEDKDVGSWKKITWQELVVREATYELTHFRDEISEEREEALGMIIRRFNERREQDMPAYKIPGKEGIGDKIMNALKLLGEVF